MFTRDIGIDLGTSNTMVCVKGRGIIMREPSVVAVDVRNDNVLAVGSQAKEMIGRTPGSIVAVRPLKNGVISDFDVTATMLKKFLRDAVRGSLFARARVMICIPAGVTEVESHAVYDAAVQAGARDVDLIEEPMAAAIGAGLPAFDASGSMIVDIGGGTTDVAIISLGDIVTSRSIRTAGEAMDEAIVTYIRRKHNLLIGDRTAEQLKISIGSAYPLETEGSVEIKGRNLVDGLPKNVLISTQEVREAIGAPIAEILDVVKLTLENTPPELAADIIDRGITLTGGGAMLRGLDRLLSQETGMNVHVADNPLDCVAKGTLKRLEMGIEGDYYEKRRKYE